MRIMIGIFLILHGIVHWVLATPQEKGPEGKPFSALTSRWLVKQAGVDPSLALRLGITLMILASAGFILSGIALLCSQQWWSAAVIPSAVVSLFFLALYWDKWLLSGALLDVGAILLALLWKF